ncbi:50S ribosomal protein L32 [Candidatus Dependentiae bacterium]|nr:MAG: 50S ribosomal protein L32 [Candidatus Dependentiae bacterium]
MPVPKRKRSHARKRKRYANKQFAIKAFTNCLNCKEVILPHQVCKQCGFYKGVKILTTKADRSLTRGKACKAKSERKKTVQQVEQESEQT